MKKLILTLFFTLLAHSAFAQTPWTIDSQYDPQNWFKQGCPLCGVVGWLDVPGPAATVSRTDLLAGNVQFQGWGFECASGAPVSSIYIYVETDQQNADGTFQWKPVPQGENALQVGYYRPDVQQAYASACPAVSGNTGWSLMVSSWPDWALGARRVTLILYHGPFHAPLTKTYNIVP